MKYRIAYYIGEKIDIKTKVTSGNLTLTDDKITIEGNGNLVISNKEIKELELFRLHGLGRMIRMVAGEKTIFLTVPRLNILGYFIIINFLKTGKLFKSLQALQPKH